MNNCDNVLMAKMAGFDGEETEISLEQLNSHLMNCENCRTEIEEMQKTFTLLKRQKRLVQDADLWPVIESRIEEVKSATQSRWRPFLFLGIFLTVYKLLEMLPERDFGLAFKIVPLTFVFALFVFLKENPFKINTDLILEKQKYEYE